MSKAKSKTIKETEIEIDDDMPLEDADEVESDPDPEVEELDDLDDSDSGDEEEDDLSAVVVTQPSTEGKPSLECVMDLTPELLSGLNSQGKAVFWGKSQVACVLVDEDGLYTVWKLRGSVPGKTFLGVDGASSITVGESKSRLNYPITWQSHGNGVFKAKVWAFDAEFGPDFLIETNVDSQATISITTDADIAFGVDEFDRYADAARWTKAVAAWFEQTHAESSEDDGE